MKKTLLFSLLLTASIMVCSQNYVRQTCPYCNGNGRLFSGYYDYYGNPIFSPCANCMGYGYVLTPTSSNNVSFKSKLVSLKSASGGKTYAQGTYYPEQNIVVLKDGTRLNVTSYSDVKGYNRMIVFDNGTKWYFNY